MASSAMTKKTLPEGVNDQIEYLKKRLITKLRSEDSKPIEVVPKLYIGSIGCTFDREKLQAHGISHILTCAKHLDPQFEDSF